MEKCPAQKKQEFVRNSLIEMSIIDVLSSKVKAVQTKIEHFLLDGANNYSNCQTVFRNFHTIEEGTYVGSSPVSRTGYEQGNFEKNVLSKLGIG